MRTLIAMLLIVATCAPLSAAPRVYSGVAARHESLAHVARKRGMSDKGVLFASPLVPLGTRLCVSSKKSPKSICGIVVDVPMPQHRAWQLRTGRIIEVQNVIARRLCADPTGLPANCPVTVEREE